MCVCVCVCVCVCGHTCVYVTLHSQKVIVNASLFTHSNLLTHQSHCHSSIGFLKNCTLISKYCYSSYSKQPNSPCCYRFGPQCLLVYLQCNERFYCLECTVESHLVQPHPLSLYKLPTTPVQPCHHTLYNLTTSPCTTSPPHLVQPHHLTLYNLTTSPCTTSPPHLVQPHHLPLYNLHTSPCNQQLLFVVITFFNGLIKLIHYCAD